MTIQEKITADITAAMKAGDKSRVGILRYLLSQIKYAQIDAPHELDENHIQAVIAGQVKKIKESRDLAEKGGRTDAVEQADLELKTYAEYLPAQLNDADLEEKIRQIIQTAPAGLTEGALIGYCIKQLAGKADNSQVARAVQKITAR